MILIGKTVFCVIGEVGGCAHRNIGGVKIYKISLFYRFANFLKVLAKNLNLFVFQIVTNTHKVCFVNRLPCLLVVVRNIEKPFVVHPVKSVKAMLVYPYHQSGAFRIQLMGLDLFIISLPDFQIVILIAHCFVQRIDSPDHRSWICL